MRESFIIPFLIILLFPLSYRIFFRLANPLLVGEIPAKKPLESLIQLAPFSYSIPSKARLGLALRSQPAKFSLFHSLTLA